VAEAVISNGAISLMNEASEDAVEAAVREYARLVYRVTYSVLRNHHDAEDATQEVFVLVLRHRSKLQKVGDRKAWLARIAWRVAIDRRKKAPEMSLDDAGTNSVIFQIRSQLASAEEFSLGQEITELLESLIAALPDQLRNVLTLSTVQDLTPSEIAELLAISESSVRSRMFRARLLLKDKLTVLLERKHGI
jgi:RNA polymerase sigma-70 factor, ECF subfamily